MKISNRLLKVQKRENVFDITTDGAKFRIIFLKADIIRIRCTFEKEFSEEASYTLVTTAWPDRMDSLLDGERIRIEPYTPVYEENEENIHLKSEKLKVIISKDPFGMDIFDNAGNCLFSDLKERSYVKDQLGRVYHYSSITEHDCFYGFGEKTGYLNKAKRRLRMNNVDTLGYDSEFTDPLYKHIPFYIKLNRTNKIACGMFYHNSYQSIFDMGCERSGYWRRYSYFCADGGDIDLFFIYGPDVRNVVKNYTDLTGKTAFPPMYSLGYMGSTMYYTELEENSDEAVLDFVDKANKHDIPCDGFHLSSGYTTGEDGKRYVFNWNKRRFKDPQKFVEQMKKKGIVLSPNVKPGMLVTHPLYDKFKEKEAYILDNKGENPHIDRYWGGKASFVDFTNPAARELWKKHMKEAIISLGITAIWNDNCEYEINDPEAICSFEDQKAAVSTLRPILPNLMALAAYQAVLEMYPDTRPYILNRAGFAGIQRYAQTWAGDNYTSWKSLKFNIPVMLGMGLSGVANQGIDIGGFDGPAPEPELLVRWVQNAAFYPRFCIHSCNTDNTVTEPWMYPSYTHYIREAIKFRYRLIPYLYSLIHEASTVGSPVMRPLLYEFQEDTKVYEESFDFMCGPYLLVAGVFEKGQKQRTVYLPQGSEWYDWDTREKYQGGQEITVETPLDKIPVFFRSGSIIPMSESRNNLQLEKITKLNLLIEPWAKSEFVLYEDDGTSNQYLNGQYCKTHITVANADTHISIAFNSCGNYKSEVTDICLDVVCRDAAPLSIKIDDNKLKAYLDKDEWQKNQEGWYYSAEKRSVQIKYKKPDHSYRVSISFSVKDLISI